MSLNSLIEDLAGDQVLGYTIVSVGSFVCYEYLIMLDHEIRYLWNRRISFGGALLFLCRYLPFTSLVQIYFFASATDLHQSNCITGFRTSTIITYIQFLLSILVLFTRAYAVWACSKRILCLLVLTYVGVIVGGTLSVVFFMRGVGSVPLIGSSGCLVQVVNDDLWIALTILIYSESLAFALLLIKALMHARELKNVDRSSSKKDILSVMAQDGLAYFACNLAITSTNLFLLKNVNPDYQDIFIIIQGALENVLCSRLLFHIRIVSDLSDGSQTSRTTLSSWRAAVPKSTSDDFCGSDDRTSIDSTPFEPEKGDVEKGAYF